MKQFVFDNSSKWSKLRHLKTILLIFLITTNTISYLLVVLRTFLKWIVFSRVETSIPLILKHGSAFYFIFCFFYPVSNTSCRLANFPTHLIIHLNLVRQNIISSPGSPAAPHKKKLNFVENKSVILSESMWPSVTLDREDRCFSNYVPFSTSHFTDNFSHYIAFILVSSFTTYFTA